MKPLLAIIFFVSKVLGVLPLSCTKSLFFKRSITGIALAIINSLNIFIYIYCTRSFDVGFIVCCFASMVCIINSLWFQTKLANYLSEIAEITRKLNVYFNTILMFLILSFEIFQIVSPIYLVSGQATPTIPIAQAIWIFAIPIAMECQYTVFCLILQYCFKSINFQLKSFLNQSSCKGQETISNNRWNLRLHQYSNQNIRQNIFKIPWHNQIFPFDKSKTFRAHYRHFSASDITKLKDFYEQLYVLCTHLNYIYGFQMLVTTTMSVSVVIVSAYNFVESISVKNAIWSLLILIHRLLKLSYICYRCDKTRDEASKTLSVLHELSYADCYPSEVQQFERQVKASQVTFSASGFYTFEIPLIHSILATTITYLVIMIQFNSK